MRLLPLCLFLVASCNLAPRYCRPDMALAESYRFAFPDPLAYANLPWWEQFGDPVLNDLISTALKNNQTLQQATATVLEFYAQYQIEFSRLFPQLSVQGLSERTWWGVEQTKPLSFFYQLYLNLSYQFDFWGRIRNAVESANASYLAQVDVRLNTILSIIGAVAHSYVSLLRLDNQLAISKKTLGSRQEMVRISTLRYKAGLTSLMELKEAEAQLQDAQVQVQNFQGLIPVQENLLSVLLGQQPGPIPRGKLLHDLNLPPPIPIGLPSDLLENRPDIMAAEQELIAARARIGSERAAFFPQIDLTGINGKQSLALGDLLKGISTYTHWEVQGSQPLYTGGALTGALDSAEAIYWERYHNYQQTVLTALQQVSDALVSFETAKAVLVIQKQEIESNQVYRKLAELRYYNGLTQYLTIQVAEENLFDIQLAAESTRATIFSSLIDLYIALGQGWDVEADYCAKCDNPYPLWKALFIPK